MFFLKKQENPLGKVRKKNPLEPLKLYMASLSRISREFFDYNANLSELLKKTSGNLINSKLKLEEMLTISLKKSSIKSNNSLIKKMLHVPSLLIYENQEIPIKNANSRKKFKEWITIWQNDFQEDSSRNPSFFIKVFATFWNNPEGNLSVIMELISSKSLHVIFH